MPGVYFARVRGLSESTIYGALLVVRALYRLAVRRGVISRSPLDGLDPAELPRPRRGGVGRVLTEAELAALVRHASDYYRPIVTLLAFSGMRISEAAGLRWRGVDFVVGEIAVTLQLSRARKGEPSKLVPVKTQASVRSEPIFPAVDEMLVRSLEVEQRAGRGRDDDFVFCTRRGTPLQQRNVARRGVAAAAAAAGLGHITPHDLRRSVCSLAARRRVDPVAAAEVTGHSLVVWATSYVRSYGRDQRREARDRLIAYGFGAIADDGRAATALPSEPPSVIAETQDDKESPHTDDGRTWDRSRRGDGRLEATSGDCSSLLQGLLVDAEGRPISLSATGFHSALGQIRDKLAGSEVVGQLARALLRELSGR